MGADIMLLWVVKTPDGWQHARIEQVGPDRASALQDGIGALRAHGLTHSGEPQYFTFRGLNFWVLRVGEKQFMYSAMAQNQPTLAGLGIDRNNIHQSETVLTKLQSLPVSEESSVGGGAGGEVHYVSLVASALGGIVVGAAGIYAFLRRRAHRVT